MTTACADRRTDDDAAHVPARGADPAHALSKNFSANDSPDALSGTSLRRAMGLVTLAWVFGSVWVTVISGAPVALFAHHLGASRFEFGLLSALPFIASLASMPASWLTERTGARKQIFLFGMYTQRLMWFPIALAPLWIVARYGTAAAPAAMTLFLVLVFIMHAGGAVGGPGWMSWMADVVPERVRGKYFSRRRQWGILSAIPAALFAGWLLDRLGASSGAADPYRTLRWCAILFMCATVFGVTDIALFHFVPGGRAAPKRSVPMRKLLLGPLKNKQFLWFGGFVATLTFAISFMGQFVTLYCIERVGVTNTGVQLMLLVAPMLAQLIVLPVWGRAADRLGKKPVLVLASLGLVPVGLGWCLMNSGTVWLGYALSALGAAFWTGVEVANLNLVLEFSGTGENGEGGSSYVAVNSVIINIAGCLGGLASGIIAQSLGDWRFVTGLPLFRQVTFYEILFALSGVLRLFAVVVFLPHLHEQGAAPAREALRFMTANIYNNLFTAVFQPIRYLKLRVAETTNAQAQPVAQSSPAPLKRAA